MPFSSESPEQNVYYRVGGRIRKARMAAGLTQAALANIVSLSRTSITNIEKGRQPIQLHTLFSIASALKMKVSDLLPENEIINDVKVKPKIPDHLDQQEKAWIETLVSEGDIQS